MLLADTAESWLAAHYDDLVAWRRHFHRHPELGRQEFAELFGQVDQDGAGFEHPDRLGAAAVHQGRNLGIGIGGDKAAAELKGG